MSVASIMTTDVVQVSMDATLGHVRELFEAHAFHHLLVTERERVVGLISDRDVLENLSPYIGTLSERGQDSALLTKRAHQIMTRRPATVTAGASLRASAEIMLENGISCLPVVDEDHRCRGIVTSRDLLRWSLRCMDELDSFGGDPEACAA